MQRNHTELRPDKSLVDPHFEGYKLSLESLAVHDLTLKKGVETVRCPDAYYSFHHVRLYSEQNSLFLDPFNTRTVYFFDEFWRLYRADASANDDPIATQKLFSDAQCVYILHDTSDTRKCSERLACSISFPSNEYAVVCDGANRIQLLATNDRTQKTDSFKLLFEQVVCDRRTPLALVHSTMHTSGAQFLIDVLLMRIDETRNLESGATESKRRGDPAQSASQIIDARHESRESAASTGAGGWDVEAVDDTLSCEAVNKMDTQIGEIERAPEQSASSTEPAAAPDTNAKEVDGDTMAEQAAKELEISTESSRKEPSHVTVVEWLTLSTQKLVQLTSENNSEPFSWRVARRRRLVSYALPTFLALEPNGRALFAVSAKPLRFVLDSRVPLDTETNQTETNRAEPTVTQKPVLCSWSQTHSTVSIRIPLANVLQHFKSSTNEETPDLESSKLSKAQVACRIEMDRLDLRIRDHVVFDAETAHLAGLVHVRNSLYYIVDDTVEVVLDKVDTVSWWPSLFLQRADSNLNDLVEARCDFEGEDEASDLARLEHLVADTLIDDSQLGSRPQLGRGGTDSLDHAEVCDDELDDDSDEDATLMRIDGDMHKVTHESSLRGNRFLFAAPVALRRAGDPDKPLAAPRTGTLTVPYSSALTDYGICMRHDVDGLLWRLNSPTPTEKSSCWQHMSTFNAFAYVLASKTNRKFVSCSPACSYVAVADCRRHVFVYERACGIATTLRNRKSGQQVHSVAKQFVVTLPETQGGDENVLGMRCTDDFIFVLTKRRLLAIRVLSS